MADDRRNNSTSQALAEREPVAPPRYVASAAAGPDRDLTARLNTAAKSLTLGILIAVVGISAFGQFYTARFNGLVSPQAMQLADIADQLRHGHGFATRTILPLGLSHAAPGPEGTAPDLLNPPLYPGLLSLLFVVRGAGDRAVAQFNGLFFLLTAPFIYVLVLRLWNRTTAIFAVLAYFVSVEVISQALNASGVTLTAFFLTVSLWAAVTHLQGQERAASADSASSARRRSVWAWPLAAGACFGLAYLCGHLSLLLFLPLLWLVAAGSRSRGRAALLTLAGLALVLLPWGARNLQVSGTLYPALAGYTLLTHTPTYPGTSVFQQLPGEVPSPLRFALSHPQDLLRKTAEGFTWVYRGLFDVLNPYLFAFVVLAGFQLVPGSPASRLWRALIAMLLLQAIGLSFMSFQVSSMALLLPLLICVALGGLVQALGRIHAPRLARVGVVIGLALILLFPTVSSAVLGGRMAPTVNFQGLGLLQSALHDDALIATDQPATVAWYAKKTALLLPASPQDLDRLAQQGLAPDYLYFSAAVSAGPPQAAYRHWYPAFTDPEIAPRLGRPLPFPQRELLFERVNRRKAAPSD